tara:strand:+ start:23 stop:172 length:150 start_codon:yes stop_codon:yes gene_type:complete
MMIVGGVSIDSLLAVLCAFEEITSSKKESEFAKQNAITKKLNSITFLIL